MKIAKKVVEKLKEFVIGKKNKNFLKNKKKLVIPYLYQKFSFSIFSNTPLKMFLAPHTCPAIHGSGVVG